ncbi:MAG: hypothetical protein KDD66_05395 [Bdellovibrionales bacterium]|nr:hypothetical protein [Bdellovibrionales bacterium]
MSSKPKVIAFLRMYDRLYSVFKPILENSDYSILTDCDLSSLDLPSDRVYSVKDYVDEKAFREKGIHEGNSRIDGVMLYLMRGLAGLPYANQFNEAAIGRLGSGVLEGMQVLFRYFYTMEQLVDKFDIRCLITSPTNIARSQAVIQVAKNHGIPTVHLPHGSFADMDNFWPEPSDYFFKADDICLRTFERTQVSSAKPIVTGVPFNVSLVQPDEIAQEKRRLEARQALSLEPSENVIAFAMGGYESLNAALPAAYYLSVHSMQALIKAVHARNLSGKKTTLIIRQHPTMAKHEDAAAVESIARDLGMAEHVRVYGGDKEAVFDASNLFVVSSQKSSVIFDAFARAMPTLCFNIAPKLPHVFVDTELNKYVEVASSLAEIEVSVNRLLDDSARSAELGLRAYNFLRTNRAFTGERATDEIVKNILAISGKQGD